MFEPNTVEDDHSDHATITPANHADASMKELYALCVDGMKDGTVVAYGEIGLDYDRLEFCSMEIQQHYLVRQLKEVAITANLPLFLHNCNVKNPSELAQCNAVLPNKSCSCAIAPHVPTNYFAMIKLL
jgi:Tat protein secretion system quality control protein TatD with DNase activity